MRYLVAYDVVDDKRRARAVKCLRNFGRRIQFSVFECDLEAVDYLRMCRRMESVLDLTQDRLHIYPLCAACVRRAVVQGPSLVAGDSLSAWLI